MSAHHKTAAKAKAPPLIRLPGLGNLSLAPQADAPLLAVFGGVPVGGQSSGIYMWHYVGRLRSRYHIFVADSNTTNGTVAYRSLMDKLAAQNITPSAQILYLFSGGWRPGIQVLTAAAGPAEFSEIHLVDIWMGSKDVQDYYKFLVGSFAAKITYVYTAHGAASSDTRDYLVGQLGSTNSTLVRPRAKEDGMSTHMRTNEQALINF
jgi:hypothetical protein